MTDKLFRNETPPPLTITFDESVEDYDSVVLRFFAPRSTDALLEVDVEVVEGGLSGTATLDATDLDAFDDRVYDCLPIGINADNGETALFENPVKFLVRTLPSIPDVS